jgi:hypothetical protein
LPHADDYGYQGGSSPAFRWDAKGFGAAYKNAVRRGQWHISLGLWAECLARKENYVEIDAGRVDAWGRPVLKIHVGYGDNEKRLFHNGQQQAAEMLEAAGARRCAPMASTPCRASAVTKSAPRA